MSSLERWFPVLFALPFLFATTMLEVLSLPSELGRWLVLAVACGLAATSGFRRGPGGQLGGTTTDSCAGVVFVFFGLSAIWAIAPAYSLQRTLSFILLYGASFWYFWSYVDRRGEMPLLRLLLRTAAVVLALNLLVFGVLAPGEIIARRFQGFFENPNNLGLVCSLSLPLSFAGLFRHRNGWSWFCFVVFTLSLLASGSRTGLVAAFAGMSIIGGMRVIQGNALALFFGVLLVGMLLALSATRFFDDTVIRGDSLETLSNRTFFWELATERYIPARPWLGHGFGTDGLIHQFYKVDLQDLQLRGYGVMSSYYGLAVAVGIPGAIGFFLLLLIPPIVTLLYFRADAGMVALAATVVAGLLVGITESAIYSAGNCFAYLFLTVFALLVRRLVYRKRRIRLRSDGGLAAGRRKQGGKRKNVGSLGSSQRGHRQRPVPRGIPKFRASGS